MYKKLKFSDCLAVLISTGAKFKKISEKWFDVKPDGGTTKVPI